MRPVAIPSISVIRGSYTRRRASSNRVEPFPRVGPPARGSGRRPGGGVQRKNELIATISRKHLLGSDAKNIVLV
jgi:hypothetical protein